MIAANGPEVSSAIATEISMVSMQLASFRLFSFEVESAPGLRLMSFVHAGLFTAALGGGSYGNCSNPENDTRAIVPSCLAINPSGVGFVRGRAVLNRHKCR